MKHIKYLLVLLVTFGLLTSCIKDKQDPPMNHIPVGKVCTIKEVIEKGNGFVFDSAASVYATVTMDESNGNLNKVVYIQDSTAGMSLTFSEKTNLKQGNYLRINLNGLAVSDYNGMFTLKTVDEAANVVLISEGHHIQPKQVSISDIMTGNYNAQIVELMNVEFQDTTVKWADATGLSTENRTLQDCFDNTIIARTSGYATFADKTVPSGKGSLVAIAGVYGSTYQLYVRNLSEVKMNEPRCGNLQPIFTETFGTSQGSFTIHNVELPSSLSYVWKFSSSYGMVASAYVNSTDHAAESWLVSPAIDISRATVAGFSFDHAINYLDNFAMVSEICAVMVSTDFTNDVASATWTQIMPAYPSSGSWAFNSSGTINLTDFVGSQSLRIAFKYKSITGDAPTWEIKNVIVVSD